MRRYFIVAICLCIWQSVLCQSSFWALPDKKLMMGSCDLRYGEVIDTVRLEVAYTCRMPNEDSVSCEIALLQIGYRFTKFYGYNRWKADSIYTETYSNLSYAANMEQKASQAQCLSYEIFRNRESHTQWNIHRLPFQHNHVMQYVESIPELDWVISDHTCVIEGYECYEAKTHWGGRTWRVWFTPDIPVNEGPWKLSGLPGLILDAADTTGAFQFKLLRVEKLTKPIIRYSYKPKKVDKQQWLRYEKAVCQMPYVTLRASMNSEFYTYDPEKDEIVPLDETWTIPYNPIERE